MTIADINSSLPVTLIAGPDDAQLADAGAPGSRIYTPATA